MPKMSGHIKAFKVKARDKNKNNKLMLFCINDEKLLGKYKAKIRDLKDIEWNALPIYDERYTKTKTRTYGNKVYTNFRGLNVPKDDTECKSFTVMSINSLLVYGNKYYLRVYVDNCAHKITNKQMTDYLDDNLFEN